MSYTKEQLVELLAPSLAQETGSTLKSVRDLLETYDLPGLQKELNRQHKARALGDETVLQQLEAIRAEVRREFENSPEQIRLQQQQQQEGQEVYREYYLTQIFRAIIPGLGTPIRNTAAEQIIEGWLNPGESLTVAWFRKVLDENPSLAHQLQWNPAPLDPEKHKQDEARRLAQDRARFAELCREDSLSECEANFLVWRSTGSIAGLAPATPDERERFQEERIEAHNQALLQADHRTLRALVREESEVRRQTVQQDQARLQLDTQQKRECVMGFPLMPSDITRERIRAASPGEIKTWMKKYGNYQINSRLAGRS